MSKLKTNRNLTLINFAIVFYFILIYLLNYFKIDLVLIGVFRELLTIPVLIVQLLFLVLGVQFILKNKIHFLTLFSIILLTACAVVTIGSFF
jgi:hypothetical protein